MAPEFECGSCGVVFSAGDEPEHAPTCEYAVDLRGVDCAEAS